MRAGRASGRTNVPDELTPQDRVARSHGKVGEVTVPGGQTEAVVDLDEVTIGAVPRRRCDATRGGCINRLASGG